MKAALFYTPHSPMRIEAVDIAELLGREVLVRTAVSGVCHSDLHWIDRGMVNPVDTVREMSGGGVDYAFEAVGFGETARQAFEMRRDGGWATMLGVAPTNATVEVPAAALRREKVLTGSSMGSNQFKVDMPRYIDLYFQGKLMLDEMVTRRFRLDQVDEAFQAMREGEVIRSVLTFGSDSSFPMTSDII
ncbi:MAG: zinc-binding dehydrogenase [Candidatus Rokuibacteriota bacterium]